MRYFKRGNNGEEIEIDEEEWLNLSKYSIDQGIYMELWDISDPTGQEEVA